MERNSKLEHLRSHLKGKVVILGVGNTLRSDDAAGAVLASRLKDKVPFVVFDSGTSPENYLEKIVREKPDTIVILDTADFGTRPGEFRLLKAQDLQTANLFSTHNASIGLLINYLQTNLKVDIMILIIQPKSIAMGDSLSQEVSTALDKLENWFYEGSQS